MGMDRSILPPAPHLRTWKGKFIRVNTFYSAAGISTSMFCDTPAGRIVMEAGDGCSRDIIELARHLPEESARSMNGIREHAEDILGIVISHPHYDHYSGLLNLLSFLHLVGRRGNVRILYPEGSTPVEDLVEHFKSTLWERCPFEIELKGMKGEEELDLGGPVLRTFPVTHRNSRPGAVGGPVPAMAYSISFNGERIAYSGDTCPSPELAGFFRDADLGIVEATYDRTPRGHEKVHMDIASSLEAASLAKKYWLTHFTSASYKALLSRRDLADGVIPPVPRAERP